MLKKLWEVHAKVFVSLLFPGQEWMNFLLLPKRCYGIGYRAESSIYGSQLLLYIHSK